VTAEIEFSKKDGTLTLLADDDYKLTALVEIIQGKLAKRGVPIRNLDYGEVEQAFGGKARQTISLVQGISTEKGKDGPDGSGADSSVAVSTISVES
jgi:hypothetical protein